MKRITIPNVKLPVTGLIMGSDYFTPKRIEEVCDILDAYVEIGGNTIDTAFIYMEGESERAIGMWVQRRGNRDRINLWTKGAHPDENGSRVKPEIIREELLISLERLQTDYVDLYALHRDDPEVPVGVILEALNEQVEAGRIRAFGVSNWTHERIQEANDYAAQHGLVGISFNSPNLSLAKAKEPYWPGCVSADDATIEWHTRTGMPLFSWSSQARGFFSGRFSPEKPDHPDLVRVFYSDDNWERYRRAERLGRELGVPTIQVALAYVLNQPFPTAAIIGPQNRDEMLSCAAGANIRLTPEQLAWLDLKREEL